MVNWTGIRSPGCNGKTEMAGMETEAGGGDRDFLEGAGGPDCEFLGGAGGPHQDRLPRLFRRGS